VLRVLQCFDAVVSVTGRVSTDGKPVPLTQSCLVEKVDEEDRLTQVCLKIGRYNGGGLA